MPSLATGTVLESKPKPSDKGIWSGRVAFAIKKMVTNLLLFSPLSREKLVVFDDTDGSAGLIFEIS